MSRRSGAFPPLSAPTERERGVKFSHRLMDTSVDNPYETFSGDQFEDWVDGLKSKIRAALNPSTTVKGKQRDSREGAGVHALFTSANGAPSQEAAREHGADRSLDWDNASLSQQGEHVESHQEYSTQEHGRDTETYDANGQYLHGNEEYDDDYDYDKEDALSEAQSHVEHEHEESVAGNGSPDVLEIPDSDDEPAGIDDEEGAATNGSSPPWDESASVAGYSDEEAGASGGYVNGEESLDGGMDLDDAGYDEDVDLAGEDGEGNEEDELLLHSDDSPHGTIGNYSQPLGPAQLPPGLSLPALAFEKEVFVIDDSDEEGPQASAPALPHSQPQLGLPLPAAHFNNRIDPALDDTYEPSSSFEFGTDISQQQQPWYTDQTSSFPGLPTPLFDPSVAATFNYLTDPTAGYQLGATTQDSTPLPLPGQTEDLVDVGGHYGSLVDPNTGASGSSATFSGIGDVAFEISELERMVPEDVGSAFTASQLGDFATLLEAAAMHDPSLHTTLAEPDQALAEAGTLAPLARSEPEVIDLDEDDSHEQAHDDEIQVTIQTPNGDTVSEAVARTPTSPLFMQSDELPDHGLHVADDSALLPGELDSDEPDKHSREQSPNVEALHAPRSPLRRRSRSISPGRARSSSPQPPHIFLEKEEVPERVATEITEAGRSGTPDPEKHASEDVAEGEFDELEASGDEANSVHSALSPQQPQVVLSPEDAADMTKDEKYDLLHRPDIDAFSLMGNESLVAPGAVESEEGESSGESGESLDELFQDQEDNRDELAEEEAAADPDYTTGAQARAGSDSMDLVDDLDTGAPGEEGEEMEWSATSQPARHAEMPTSVAASDVSGDSTQDLSQDTVSVPDTHATDSMIESTQPGSQAVVPSFGFGTSTVSSGIAFARDRPPLVAMDSMDEVNLELFDPMDTAKESDSDQDIDFSAMPSQMAGFLDTPEVIGSPASAMEAEQEDEIATGLEGQKSPAGLSEPSNTRLTRSHARTNLATAGPSKTRDVSPSQSTSSRSHDSGSRESSVEPVISTSRGRRRKPEPRQTPPESPELTPQPSPKTGRGRANENGKAKGKSAKRVASPESESQAGPSNDSIAEVPTPAPAEEGPPILRTQTARHIHNKDGKSAGPTWASIKWGSILPSLRFMGGGKSGDEETKQQSQEPTLRQAETPEVQRQQVHLSRSESSDETSGSGATRPGAAATQSNDDTDALDVRSATNPLAKFDSKETVQLDVTSIAHQDDPDDVPAVASVESLQTDQPIDAQEAVDTDSATKSPTALPDLDAPAPINATGSEAASFTLDRPGLSIQLPSPLEAPLATSLLTPTADSPTRFVPKSRQALHSRHYPSTSHDAPQETGRLMRSNCQFHKISVPGLDGELEYFIAPACSIADRSKRTEVDAHDHGIATDDDHSRTIQELDYADDAAVHALRQLVGLDLLREGHDVGYIIREGETYDSLRARQPNNYFAAYRREGGPRLSLHKKRSRAPSVASASAPASEVGDGPGSALTSPIANTRHHTFTSSSPTSPPDITRRKRRKMEIDYQPGAEDEQIEERDQEDDHDTLIVKPSRSSRRKKAPDHAPSASGAGADAEQAVAGPPTSSRSGGKSQPSTRRNKNSLATTMGPPSPLEDSSQTSPRKRGKKRAAEDDDQDQEMESGGTSKKAKLSSEAIDP